MRTKPARKYKIFIIDDEKDLLEVLGKRLSRAGYEIATLSKSKNAVKTIKRTMPDLIILDIMMPGLDGLTLKMQLNEQVETAAIPVIFLSAKSAVNDKIKGLNLGADDYVTKPFDSKELLTRVKAILKRRGLYEKISMTDGLTGLYNVNFFKKQFTLFFNIAKRYKKIFSLVIVDINDFKHINDEYGHLAGDAVLKKFASIAKKTLRKSDIITRYGGDEFVMLLPETDNRKAALAVERLQTGVKRETFELPNIKKEISVSVSAGIATYADSFENETQIFELADKRLYKNKSKK